MLCLLMVLKHLQSHFRDINSKLYIYIGNRLNHQFLLLCHLDSHMSNLWDQLNSKDKDDYILHCFLHKD